MKAITVLGSINADHVISVPYFVKPGETLAGSDYHIAYGGKGANQAVAAARAGAKVGFIACIGADDIGRAMKKAFAEDGIDTRSVEEVSGQTSGVALIQVADTGENSIVISAGANACLNEAQVEKFADGIAASAYLLMQLESPLNTIIHAAKLARAHHTRVVLNPAPARPLPEELLHLVDMITPNETEAEILTGIKVSDEQSAAQAAAVFHRQGIETVLITLGAKGVFVSSGGEGRIIAGFRVKAADTTAAGDTFNGALLTALAEDKSLNQAIRFAHAAAAISVTRKGAQPSIPYREEILAFLAATQA
ncbi:ribokinase [Mesocricetibacter intestinalis]|uniref:Ribokinase n=1 Tax=Mesocricetibacter intestinalis TaxID=1521930 RepID=A0A4R6VBL5_9PAST|nr:ribokinase [Mesocricetibacter intestinalis]TDQ59668.1 ribokinase [Mesocricetibacter intestinalis]